MLRLQGINSEYHFWETQSQKEIKQLSHILLVCLHHFLCSIVYSATRITDLISYMLIIPEGVYQAEHMLDIQATHIIALLVGSLGHMS
jgi:hypothetical protein